MEESRQMASKVFIIIVIAASIACVFTQSPIKLDERHLRSSAVDNDQLSAKGWQDSVPGLPGRDYPNLTSIPETSFSCDGKTPGGYYADVETRCQVFHVCSIQGSKSSFLCPSGSIFNQRHFVCDWWYDFECYQAPELYSLNESFGDPDPSSIASLQFNSLGGPSTDLSLASSGYSNNLHDQNNLLYEAYTSTKTHDVGSVLSTETAESTITSGNIHSGSSGSRASGISNSDSTRFGIDNYSHARQKESTFNRNSSGRLNGLESDQLPTTFDQNENNGRTSDHEENLQSTTYRTRPIQNLDIVPRGFSKNRSDEQIRVTYPEFKRNDHNPGFLINNGLSNEFEKNQNNYVSFNNDNEANKDNNNNYNNDDNRRYQYYYKNSENNPLSQGNNNYVNRDNYNNDNEDTNNATTSVQNNEYSIRNYINNDDVQKSNDKKISYENYYDGTEKREFNPNSNRNFDFPKEHYDQSFEASTASPQSIYLTSTEDDVDRERQREVDSVDLKRKRPQYQPRQQYGQSPTTFLIKEETSRTWRDDLSPSISDSESPPFLPRKTYLDSSSPSLSKPEEITVPVATANEDESSDRPRERPKFLGRRPTGGLPSGSGNGIPGASKILIASASITGKSSMDNDSDQPLPADTGATDTWNEDGLNNWDETESSYTPPRSTNREGGYNDNNNIQNNNDYHEYEEYGQYSNNGGPSWKDSSRPHGQY